jgi:superfamily II DNA or RNA helicase
MQLRPHQTRAIADVRAAYRRTRRVLLVMPTGAGKTHTAAELIGAAVAKGRRVVFAVHRREIVQDTARRLSAAGVPCGVIMAGTPRVEASVQVASVQTIAAREDHPPADFVIWDEAHHTAAETYRTIAAQYPAAYHLGLTATPERADGVGLRDAFDEIVVGATVRELMDAGLLAECDVVAPAKRQSGVAEDAVEAWVRLAAMRPTVAFCRTVEESKLLAANLALRGVRARHVDGATTTRERDASLAAFAAGRVDVLTNVFVLTEGWDCPRAKVCLLARGCGSESTYLQMVGRVLRPHAGERALVLDLAGVTHEHGLPDEERAYSLDGIRRQPKEQRPWLSQCAACGCVVEGVKRGPRCPRCGGAWPAPPRMRVERNDLARVASVVPRAVKDAKLRELASIAKARGYRDGWVGVRFKEEFGHWPRMGAMR